MLSIFSTLLSNIDASKLRSFFPFFSAVVHVLISAVHVLMCQMKYEAHTNDCYSVPIPNFESTHELFDANHCHLSNPRSLSHISLLFPQQTARYLNAFLDYYFSSHYRRTICFIIFMGSKTN